MRLSEHFTRAEMERSPTALRLGIKNETPPDALARMQALVDDVLEPLRVQLGRPIRITSGYRCPKLNKRIGGAATSQHMQGEAVDFEVPGMTTTEVMDFVRRSGLPFDQLIDEAPPDGWVHLSYRRGRCRRQCLKAVFRGGKAVYTPVA